MSNKTDANGTSMSNVEGRIFPYSYHYVFYEQYLTIIEDSIVHVSICLAVVFVVTFFLLGFDFWSATIIIFVIFMIMASIIGLMALWDISLNAVSLVNLVMVSQLSNWLSNHFNLF